VEYAQGIDNGQATGLCNEHQKYSEQWNHCNPMCSAHESEQAALFSQER
jgi:hypothetical protein